MAELVLMQHMLLAVLRNHIGRARGITARNLVEEVNAECTRVYGPEGERFTERSLRSVVVELRKQGHHLCGHPRDGYFIAETAEELLETLAFLNARAETSHAQERAMRRTALGTLFGQQMLPT